MATERTDEEFRGRLAVELEAWQRDGLITPQQASGILSRYEVRGNAARAFRLGPVATFISVVGAVVLGTGVVYFFAANWGALPAWFKVLLVYTGTGAAYAAGYWVQFRSGVLPRVGASLILLGALLYQAGFFLLAQIFNMPVDSPVALLLGAAGILPLAYALGARLVLVLGLVDLGIWLAWELLRRYPDSPESYAVPLAYILYGVLLYGVGSLHRLRRDPYGFVPVYQVLGVLAIVGPAYFFTFGATWEEAQRHDLAALDVPLWFGGAVLAALLTAASPVLGRRERGPLAVAEAVTLMLIVLIVALVAYVPRWADAYALVFNGVYFGLALLLVVRGDLYGEPRFVNLGIPLLALGLITRYVDVFWDLLPRSAFYITGGLVLLGVAAGLERLRRRLLSGGGQASAARPAQG